MQSTRSPIQYILTTDQVAQGDMQHVPILCIDFKTIVLQLLGASMGANAATYTVEVQGSMDNPNKTPVNFSTIQTVEYTNGNAIDGATGLPFAGNANVILELNTNRMVWMKITISSYTSGKLDANATLSEGI